jgi:hypothetical protein
MLSTVVTSLYGNSMTIITLQSEDLVSFEAPDILIGISTGIC